MSHSQRFTHPLVVAAGLAVLLAAVLPTAAAAQPQKAAPVKKKPVAPAKWKVVAEEGFKGEIPADWERTERCEAGKRKRFSWTYKSQKRNFTFRVIISPDRGNPLKASLADAWNRAKRRLKSAETIREDVIQDGKREIAIILARTIKTRRTNDYPYLVARIVSRVPGSRVRLGLQLEAHGERIDELQVMIARLMEKIELDRPDLLFAAKK